MLTLINQLQLNSAPQLQNFSEGKDKTPTREFLPSCNSGNKNSSGNTVRNSPGVSGVT